MVAGQICPKLEFNHAQTPSLFDTIKHRRLVFLRFIGVFTFCESEAENILSLSKFIFLTQKNFFF